MRVPFTSTQRLALHGLVAVSVWLAVHALLLALIFAHLGCQNRLSRGIVAEQKPGLATGAGATFTGPANSGAASTQVAQRRVAYYAPPAAPSAPVAAPLPVRTESPAALAPEAAPVPVSPLSALSSQPPSSPLAPPAPAWIDERTETTFGPHQDAAGLMKAATAIGSWGRARWFGILCLLAAVGGLLYAHGNPEGYPLICWKVGAVGVFLAVFDPSPWWLLLLILPAGFYVVQKLNLLRLP